MLEGHLLVDLEERTVDLQRWQGLVVPRGLTHRTRAPERVVVLGRRIVHRRVAQVVLGPSTYGICR